MVISSPGLIVWADLAVRAPTVTNPASQSFCATERRGQRRLALRNRSRRIREVGSRESGVESRESRVRSLESGVLRSWSPKTHSSRLLDSKTPRLQDFPDSRLQTPDSQLLRL